MVRFEKFKNWNAADNVLYRDIVPMGGTAGQKGQNQDCPAKIGTIDRSVISANKVNHLHHAQFIVMKSAASYQMYYN